MGGGSADPITLSLYACIDTSPSSMKKQDKLLPLCYLRRSEVNHPPLHTHTHTHMHRAFAPLLQVLRDMSDQLSSIHGQFVEMLNELTREIFDYNTTQKDKMKTNVNDIYILMHAILASD